jgi:hypothetical protein
VKRKGLWLPSLFTSDLLLEELPLRDLLLAPLNMQAHPPPADGIRVPLRLLANDDLDQVAPLVLGRASHKTSDCDIRFEFRGVRCGLPTNRS